MAVGALAGSGALGASGKELTKVDALHQARIFLSCEKRPDVRLGDPFSKGSYWLVPAYGADGKRLSNVFVSLNTGEVSWPDNRSSKCSAPVKGKQA